MWHHVFHDIRYILPAHIRRLNLMFCFSHYSCLHLFFCISHTIRVQPAELNWRSWPNPKRPKFAVSMWPLYFCTHTVAMSLVFLGLGQLKIELSRLSSICAIRRFEFSRFVSEQRVESAEVIFPGPTWSLASSNRFFSRESSWAGSTPVSFYANRVERINSTSSHSLFRKTGEPCTFKISILIWGEGP